MISIFIGLILFNQVKCHKNLDIYLFFAVFRNLTISSGYAGYNVGNSSYCNHPFIPQQQQLYNITLCVPQCGWSPLTRDENYQINATTYTACVIAIISLILILMTWCKVSELLSITISKCICAGISYPIKSVLISQEKYGSIH